MLLSIYKVWSIIVEGLSIPEMALLITLISLFGGITTGNLVALFYRHKRKQDEETKNEI